MPGGQETPGTNRRLREDLYKKFMSAEGISGRKPYGLRTRMIECRGWKRLEANRMFQFQEVSNKDFNAILRRSLVWRVQARFEDPQAIEGLTNIVSLVGRGWLEKFSLDLLILDVCVFFRVVSYVGGKIWQEHTTTFGGMAYSRKIPT